MGENFIVTRAGIHADGLLKDEEIYNIFDTGKLLNRPPKVSVNQNSGLAGIALWINDKYHFEDSRKVDKNSDLVKYVKLWIDTEYENGRSSVISNEELEKLINDYFIMK